MYRRARKQSGLLIAFLIEDLPGASRYRRKPRPEHEPIADDRHRVRLPRLIIAAQPPLAAFPICDLGRVLAEYHPVEPFLSYLGSVAHPFVSQAADRGAERLQRRTRSQDCRMERPGA